LAEVCFVKRDVALYITMYFC